MDEAIMKHDAKTSDPARLFPMEHISINHADGYVDVDAQIDLAHGCAIVTDVVVDVAADLVVDAVTDAVTDGVADGVADAAADAANSAADGAAADAAGDAAADAAESGLSPSGLGRLKMLGLMLGTAMMEIAHQASSAANDATAASAGSGPPTANDYWTALYNTMVKNYPCDLPASQSCPTKVRASQEALIGSFAVAIANKDAAAAAQAKTFALTWPSSSQVALKQALNNISNTAGIPSMVQYMETYTDPGATGGALVIATAGVLMDVTGFAYTN